MWPGSAAGFPILSDQWLPIPDPPSSTAHTIPSTALPHGDAVCCSQPRGKFQKMAQKVFSEVGLLRSTELQVPIVPKRGQKRWGPPIPGNCKPARPQRRFQYRELKQRHCTFWCCISKPKLNMSSSGSRLKQMCQNKTFYLSGAFMSFLEA